MQLLPGERVDFSRWEDLAAAEKGGGNIFLSRGWIETWRDCLPEGYRSRLRLLADGAIPVALLTASQRHRGRVLWLHQCGDATCDGIAIEYNGFSPAFMAQPDAHGKILTWLKEELRRPGGADEIVLAGVRAEEWNRYAAAAPMHHVWRDVPGYFVDLAGLRDTGRAYESVLSRNARQQLRRARRRYEAHGPLRLERAGDVETALDWFAGLEALHQRTWQARGRAGAFANPFFGQFHQALIRRLLPAGGVEVLRITAGERLLGYLYNLRSRTTVYAYASGFDYPEDSRYRPGIVSHALCIEDHLAAGARIYDFLAGEGRYKRSLSTGSYQLIWGRLRRRRARFMLEATLRWLKARLQGRGG